MALANRNLNQFEVLEFENGRIGPLPKSLETKGLMDKVLYERYMKEDLEIPEEDMELDLGNPLGTGEYGCVYRATLRASDGMETTVAVKSVNPLKTDVVCFKALLTELKIMSYMGKHEYVINLIGASTAGITERKLHIVLEFCPYGDLRSFLRGARGLFHNMVRGGSLISNKEKYCDSPNIEDSSCTSDLFRWSYQIASGMQYLESRKIVHGDLATRNILLTEKKDVKIADFGLARQLYEYSVYVKKQNTPLPWRWLSLESLTDMTYSSRTDVWSYGVTLWEIFTLGETPWPGIDFNFRFVENLKQGQRMQPPLYATDDVYKLMVRCWNLNPLDRPDFQEMYHFLSQNFTDIFELENSKTVRYTLLPEMIKKLSDDSDSTETFV